MVGYEALDPPVPDFNYEDPILLEIIRFTLPELGGDPKAVAFEAAVQLYLRIASGI